MSRSARSSRCCSRYSTTGSRWARRSSGVSARKTRQRAAAVTAGNAGDVEPVTGLLHDLLTEAGDPDSGAHDEPDTCASGGEDAAAIYGAKDSFDIDLDARTVTCPNGVAAMIRPVHGHKRHAGKADFGAACATCPLRAQCTEAKTGRSITIGHHEAKLTAARTRQTHPAGKADYCATRPKVERKIGHLMRRRHGGRRARMRGRLRIAADFALLAPPPPTSPDSPSLASPTTTAAGPSTPTDHPTRAR